MKRQVLAVMLSTAAMVVFSAQVLQAQEVDETISVEIVDGGFVDYGSGLEGGDGGEEPILVICPGEIELPEIDITEELVDPPMDRGGEDCAECRDFTVEVQTMSDTSVPEMTPVLAVQMSDDAGGLATPELVNCSTKANERRSVCLASVAD